MPPRIPVAHAARNPRSIIDCYLETVTVTISSDVSAPSSARAQRTYVPGSSNVTCTVCLPSAGNGGADQNGAHGEFAPLRVSSHALTCAGSNVTFPPPRYTYQEV